MNLEGKVAVVTGGGRDIGRAVSIKLAASGARVAINYLHNEASAVRTADEVRAGGGQAIVVRGDVTKAADVQGLVDGAAAAFGGRIDILVNVAGGLVARKPLAEMDEDFFDHVMALNLKSAFLATRAAVPFMTEGGCIVNFSSIAGRDGGGPGAGA